MTDSGIYQILIHLDRNRRIQIGKLGLLEFKCGYYIYTGSAKANLKSRIKRHYTKDKKLRWHIDYLLQYAVIISHRVYEYGEELEHRQNNKTYQQNKEAVFIKNFGSSDCKCESHLIYFNNKQIHDWAV